MAAERECDGEVPERRTVHTPGEVEQVPYGSTTQEIDGTLSRASVGKRNHPDQYERAMLGLRKRVADAELEAARLRASANQPQPLVSIKAGAWDVLRRLARRPVRESVDDMADALGMTKRSVLAYVAALEEVGYLDRGELGGRERAYIVTPAGVDALGRI